MPFAAIAPTTTLTLYKIPHYGMNENLCAKSKAVLNSYLNGFKVMENVGCTYQRKTGRYKIAVDPSVIGTLNTVNLCSWINPAYENLLIYAKVTGWEYINNKVAEISFSIDWWLTYMGLVDFEPGFIEREHLSEDSFNKAEANPWDNTVWEFLVNQDIPVGDTMYEMETDSYTLWPRINKSSAQKCILFYVSNFDALNVPGGFEAIASLASEVIHPNGAITGGAVGLSLDLVVPRAYYTFVLYGDAYDNRIQFLNQLTAAGLDGNIISAVHTYRILYDYMKSWNASDPTPQTFTISNPTVSTQYENKILYRAPFSYVEVRNNNGDKKDWMYEYSYSDGGIKIEYVPIFEPTAYSSLVPVAYMSPENLPNINERVDSTPFPQMGYSTDSYLAFLATKNQSMLAERYGVIETAPEKIQQLIADSGAGSALKAAGIDLSGSDATAAAFTAIGALQGVASSGGGVVSSAAGALQGGVQGYDRGKQYGIASDYRNDALAGSDYYGSTRPAYVAHDYTPATQPELSYNVSYPIGDQTYEFGGGIFMLIKMQMRSAILSVFDQMFHNIGYKSNRTGVPRVCNYVKNASQDAYLPHFNNEGFTYCKCTGLHVTGAPLDVVSSIEQMFAAGVRFYEVK